MTLSTTVSRISYPGTGSVGPFAIPFRILSSADLLVTKRDAANVESVPLYSVAGVGDATSTLTLTTALAIGETLFIRRKPVLTQPTSIRNQGTYFPATIEDALDRLTMQVQSLQDSLDRSVKLKESVVGGASLTELEPTAGYVVTGTGLGFTMSPISSGAVALPGNGRTTTTLSAYLVNNAVYNPKDWGVTFDGVTNDTVRWTAFLSVLPANGFIMWFPNTSLPSTTLVDASVIYGRYFNGKSNFRVYGNGSVIKALDGTAVIQNYDMMSFESCTDGYMENLTIDANRANRTINFGLPAGAYNLTIYDSCKRLHFKKVRCINSVIDGFMVGASLANFGNIGAYPTDITFEDCEGSNAVRCGLSLITSVRAKIIRGRYTGSVGSAPQCGIDLEPDPGTTSFGNVDPSLIDVDVSDNTKFGLVLAGPSTATNHDVVIRGLRGRNNGDGFINIGSVDGLDLDFVCGTHTVATRGIVDLAAGPVKGVRIGRGEFSDITAAAGANSCIYVHGAVLDTPEINLVSFKRVACCTMVLNRRTLVNGYSCVTCTKDPEIQLVGSACELRNAVSEGASGRSLYIGSPDVIVDGFSSIDSASTQAPIFVDAGGDRSTILNAKVQQRTAIPGGAVGILYNTGVVPWVLRNFTARSAGTDYTPATVATFTSGTAGARISGVTPDPFRASLVYDPPSIANGAKTTQAVTVTGAALGDAAFVAPGLDVAGLTVSASVTAANTVTIVLANNTGGAVDLGSSTWIVWVEKRA